MNRWLLRLAFPALALLVILILFGLKAPEPSPGEVVQQPASNSDMPAFESLVPAPVPADGPHIVFKWQDPGGNWHYADQPPAQGPWNTLAIEPGPKSPQPVTPQSPDPATEDLSAPDKAPFALQPRYPGNGS